MGCCFGGQRCREDLHKANVACLTHWQSRGWCRWHGGRLWCTPWVNGMDLCQILLLSLFLTQTHGSHSLLCLSFSLIKILTWLAQALKHYKIRKHQNHSKCLYVTCCPVLTGLLITQSHLLFSLVLALSQSQCLSQRGAVYVQHALSPAYFANQTNLALKWYIF